ncbi:MAG: hypothetical protein GEV11_26650 [Streptosporangiales bacterium]|nr:hypothetical protein [Streptosporangiales bacterium]
MRPYRRPARPTRRIPWLVAAAVAVTGGAALFGALGPGGPEDRTGGSSASPSPKATAASRTPPPGPGLLASRATDPEPLTLDEVFEQRTLRSGGDAYEMTGRHQEKDCTDAVAGAALREALDDGDCTQLLRASFHRRGSDVMGTFGVANLRDVAAARAAESAAAQPESFLEPLPGSGDTRRLGQGIPLAGAQARGHYLILTWVQFADGHRPEGDERDELSRFAAEVGTQTLDAPLEARRTTGKPTN